MVTIMRGKLLQIGGEGQFSKMVQSRLRRCHLQRLLLVGTSARRVGKPLREITGTLRV